MGKQTAGWLAAFLSPTASFLLLTVWSRLQVPAPPAGFVVTLFCLIPVVALLVCGTVVWRKKPRVGWLVLTVLAMALQVGVLLVIIVSAITVAISLP